MTDTKLQKEILQKYLESYPCKTCEQFKRFEREANGWSRMTGGFTGMNNDKDNFVVKLHHQFIEHIKDKHLPNEKEWEILKHA